jgi:enoyl-CoA hydratase
MEHGKANALDTEFCEVFVRLLEELRGSPLRALIITGSSRIFSAGVDLLRVLEGGPVYVRRFLPSLCNAFETLFCFPKPVLAAINGHAIAGGCVFACAADHRLMAMASGRNWNSRTFGRSPFSPDSLGDCAADGGTSALSIIGLQWHHGSPQNKRKRMAWWMRLVEPEELLNQAMRIAEAFASLPPGLQTTLGIICKPHILSGIASRHFRLGWDRYRS